MQGGTCTDTLSSMQLQSWLIGHLTVQQEWMVEMVAHTGSGQCAFYCIFELIYYKYIINNQNNVIISNLLVLQHTFLYTYTCLMCKTSLIGSSSVSSEDKLQCYMIRVPGFILTKNCLCR